jgi:hypothetical protein
MDGTFETPLKYAVENGHGDVAELLRQHGGRLRTAGAEMKLSVRDKQVYAGDIPFFLSSYDADGGTGGVSGSSGVRLSADLRGLILHFSEVPWDLTLGIQVGGANGLNGATAALRRNLCRSAFIDSEGLVFPGEATEVDQAGPSITLQFDFPTGHTPFYKNLTVQVKTKSGRDLKVNPDGSGLLSGLLTFDGVPRETLYVTIESSASGKKWWGALFPAFRSASGGVVIYKVTLSE